MSDGSKMKSTLVSLVTWCLLVGGLNAQYNVFLPHSTHKYDYKMMVWTTTSTDDPQVAAVAFDITAIVDTPTPDKAIVKFEDIRVAKVNDELRKTEIEDSKLEFKQIPEYSRNLSYPFEIKFKNGQVEKISFTERDGFTSREMKKAFAQTLQVNLEGHSSRNALAKDSNRLSSFYRVMEPSLSGICETQYILKHLKDPACPSCKVLNITKIRDYRNCEEKVHFVHTNHPTYKCSDCEADASHPVSKNTIISLNLKWQDGNYLLENATSTGIIKLSPLGEQSDQYIAVFNKTIDLIEVRPMSRPIEVRTENIETLLSEMTDKVEKAILDPQRKDPIPFPFVPKLASPEKIIAKLNEVAETIERDPSKKSWRSALSNIVLLVKAMRQSTYSELETILSHITGGSSVHGSYSQRRYDSESEYDESQHTQRRYSSDSRSTAEESINAESWDAKRALYWDLLAQTGTYPALLLWKKYTLKTEITPIRSLKFIQVFATHCIFPRPQILEVVMEVIKSEVVRQDEQLFNTIVMSYGTLVSRTCLRDDHYWQNVVEPKDLCPEPKKYLQFLAKMLEEVESPGKKMAVINAIGETRLRDAVMFLRDYAIGDATDCEIIQTEAVLALGKCAKLHPSVAKDILWSVFYDIEEVPKVRIAALVSLYKTDLNRHALEKIAMFTWEEPDTTVGTFVIKSLEAIANSSHPCIADLTSHAEHALELIDDTFDDGLPLVHHVFFEQELPEFDITSLLVATYVADGHPLAPKIMRAHYRPHIAGYATDIFKFSHFGSGTKSLLDQLIGPVAAFNDMSLEDVLKSVDRPNRNVGLNDLAQKLGIKPREDDETKGVLKFSFLGSQQRLFYYNKEKLVKLASSYSSSILNKLQKGYDFEYQRTMMPLDINIITPTPVGLPLVFRIKSPVHWGIRGHVKVNVEGDINNLHGVKVDLNLKPIFAAKLIPCFGVKLPQEKILVGATYNTMVIVKPTIAGELAIRKDNEQLSVIIKPKLSPKEQTILHFSTHPMTYLYKYDSFKPIFESALPITFLDKPKEYEYHLGPRKSSLISVKVKHDTFWHNRASIWDWFMRIADPSSLPLAFLTQSWKNRVYDVVFDPSSISESHREVELKLNWKRDLAESQPQRRIVHGVRGFLTYVLGWANTEEKCSSDSSSHQVNKPWEVRHAKQFHTYASQSFMQQSRRDSAESGEDSDEDSVWNERRSKSLRTQYRNSDEDQSSEEDNWKSKHRTSYMDTMEYSKKHESMYRDERHDNIGNADVRITDSHKGESKLVVEAVLMARGDESRKIQAKLVLKKQHDAPIRTMDLVVNLPGREIQQVCLRSKCQHPRVPCYYGGELPSFHEKEYRSEFNLQWGHDCSSPSGFVDVQIVANKSREQLKYDPMPPTTDFKPWFYAQCQRDLAKGIPLSDECIMSLNHLGRLNHVTLVAKYEKVPDVVRNITRQLYLAASAWLYPYMSYNPINVENKEKAIKMVLDYHYDMPAVDLKVFTPTSRAFFAKLPYTEVSRILQAPNVRKPMWRKIANSLTDDGAYATAFVSGNTINTFDNQTYVYKHWGQCKHVLVMDCSTSNMFAVLNKPVGPNNKSLIVRVLKHKIEIDATAAGSDREILINGVPQRLSNEQRAFVYDKEFNLVVAYINKVNHRYIVTLPQIGLKVRYNGYTTFVRMSHIWQDKVCGVFGDYDNDFIYEYRGPKQCALLDGVEMAKAYAVPDGTCSPPSVSSKKLCETQEDRPRSSGISHSSGCTHKKTLQTTYQGKLCFSKYPVMDCNPGCSAEREETQTISFTCLDREDPKAMWAMRDIRAGRPVTDLSGAYTHLSKEYTVPERCSP